MSHNHYYIVVTRDEKVIGYWNGHTWDDSKSAAAIYRTKNHAVGGILFIKHPGRGLNVGVLTEAGEKSAPRKPRATNPAPKIIVVGARTPTQKAIARKIGNNLKALRADNITVTAFGNSDYSVKVATTYLTTDFNVKPEGEDFKVYMPKYAGDMPGEHEFYHDAKKLLTMYGESERTTNPAPVKKKPARKTPSRPRKKSSTTA